MGGANPQRVLGGYWGICNNVCFGSTVAYAHAGATVSHRDTVYISLLNWRHGTNTKPKVV